MKDNDALSSVIGFLMIGFLLLYLLIIILSVVAQIGGIAGLVWGGYESIKNYVSSFKENVITSNRQTQFV